jgi:UPF0755 protein
MTYEWDELIDAEPRTSRRHRRGRQRRRRRRFRSFLAVVVSMAVIGGIGYGAYTYGRELLGDLFAPAADYDGPGHGEAFVTIPTGTTGRGIGAILHDAGVVASVDAFVSAAQANPAGNTIQAGDYTLKLEMKAEDAVAALLESPNVLGRVTIPEGFRIDQIVDRLAEETDFSEEEFDAVLDDVDALELPDYADGMVEGFLFPATYDIQGDTTASSLISAMINRFSRAADEVDLVDAASGVGLTPLEVVSVASIIQREVSRDEDMGDVAQVIYNRMAGECAAHGVPAGLLQMDSTVHYAAGDNDSVFTSEEDRQVDSPYNTYLNAGIPPGPISAPGEDALGAALNPSEGAYCYFVTVDLETGETKFAETESAHNANRDELRAYCRESDRC